MSVELRPLGVKCNIQCQYCYQTPQRDAGNWSHEYSIEKMKEAIELEGGPFTLFGGEALLVPHHDLEVLWSWGLDRFGRNGVQTNGSLIDAKHVELFKKYKVSVGISIDGPGELNDVRWHGSLEQTRVTTEKTLVAINRLIDEGIHPGLIITIHRVNASEARVERLIEWLEDIHARGVNSVRIHLLESESEEIRRTYALSTEENLYALHKLAELDARLPNLRMDIFDEMRRLLMGNDRNTTCIWFACDPYTTGAVRGVEGQGQRSNCGRTNKDGIDFVKAPKSGFERYLALYHTPQEFGGCGGCRFFLMCKGQCPGTAIQGDWRNRTEHCAVWMGIYEKLEQKLELEGQLPLSISAMRVQVELMALNRWAEGRTFSISSSMDELKKKASLLGLDQ